MSTTPGLAERDGDYVEFINRKYNGRAHRVTFLGVGEWARAYAFQLGGEQFVIRFGLHRSDFEKDMIVGNVPGRGFCVPRTLEIGSAFRGYFSVGDRVSGRFLEELEEPELITIMPSLLLTMKRVSRLSLPGSQGYGPWEADGHAPFKSWSAYLLSVNRDDCGVRFAGWRDKLSKSDAGAAAFRIGYATLAELAHKLPSMRMLVHGDLWHRNVLVREDGSAIAGVIDWGNSLYGDPLYDVAWLIYWWQHTMQQRSDAMIDKLLGRPYRAISTSIYCRLLSYRLHISLYQQTFNAFRQRWPELELHARRAIDLVGEASCAQNGAHDAMKIQLPHPGRGRYHCE